MIDDDTADDDTADDDTADNDGVDEDCKVEIWLDEAVRENKKIKKCYKKYWGAGLCLKYYDTAANIRKSACLHFSFS